MPLEHIPQIDWEAQWAAHAPGYRNGNVEVKLHGCARKLLKLKPGPGFGDLSHPTTRLVLKLMRGRVEGKDVVDIGCGSGILSLAACAFGAASVCGIDIDRAALAHAAANSVHNGMESNIVFMTPEEYAAKLPEQQVVVLMNMIQSEQCQAWESLACLHSAAAAAITSGILAEGHAAYLSQCRAWGWNVEGYSEEAGWRAYELKKC